MAASSHHATTVASLRAGDAGFNVNQYTVLVVEDEARIASFLEDNLVSDDFGVYVARSVAQARSKLNAYRPDIVLLDVMLPDVSGFDFCREIREGATPDARYDPATPIIMLTARGDEVDRLRGFKRGIDDFLAKPFSYPELLARMHAVLRRAGEVRTSDVAVAAGLEVDTMAREVSVHGTRVALSQKEFALISVLVREPRRVFTKAELLRDIWGYRSLGQTRTLDSHASRLRAKLRPVSRGVEYIENVWGVGYRLLPSDDTGA